MSDEDYVPFGPEWKKEMMKWRKEELIDELRNSLMRHSAISVDAITLLERAYVERIDDAWLAKVRDFLHKNGRKV